METFHDLIGNSGEQILWWQMCLRAIAIFIVAIVLLRISNKRIFGKHSTFDIVLGIVLGSILGRTITGNAPFFAAIAASFVLVLMHRLLSLISYHSNFGKLFKGEDTCLVSNGKVVRKNMKKHQITNNDLHEAMHLNGALNFEDVEAAYLERNGNISIITRKK